MSAEPGPSHEEPAGPPEMETALARSVLGRALAVALRRPGADTGPSLLAAEARQAILSAAYLLDPEAAGGVREAAARLAGRAVLTPSDLDRPHQRLFGPTLRGRVCPYETEYGGRGLFQQAQELADISGFYLAFGLEPAAGREDRADHAACELDFYAFLALKEAYALERGDAGMLEVTRAAARRFLREHLGRFGRAVALALAREDPEGFFGDVGRLGAAFLEMECRRLAVPAGPDLLDLRPAGPDGVPAACGAEEGDSSEADLVQIEPARRGARS